ncbi:MAG: hypothetical protein CUN55_05870 [Phototrophicales bacterium]|nr:MAG: hypothetical protein CUN55_05870 [Phototrophicales bacterium]
MIAELGIVALAIAFIAAVFATIIAFVAALKASETLTRSARNLLLMTFPLLTLACLLLIWGQWTGEYSIAYVSNVSSDAQPSTLKITALWGSQAGSMLFYGWMLSLFSAAAVLINWRSHHHLMAWVMVFTSATLGFFLGLSMFYENPFERFWMDPSGAPITVETAVFQPEGKVEAFPWQTTVLNISENQIETLTIHTTSPTLPPTIFNPNYEVIETRYDGKGLNPLLRHPGMVIHPPMLYLGFTGFVIPFAFGMAALMIGQMNAEWIRAVRGWSLVAWMFLSIGLVLGGRWAYDVLGWGGYWGWDPVENSALLPWLTGTAFLHSVMIQEKRGMLKGWNMAMIIITYLLVLFGTVATRTGLLSSVHTFAQSPLAIPMGTFLGGSLLFSTVVFLWRGQQGYFKGDHEIEGILSRESMFLLNNWIFLALTVVIFFGTWVEKITDVMVGLGLRESVITLGRSYYEPPVAVLFLLLYILMGVAPLVAWRRATLERVGQSLRLPALATVMVMVVLPVMGIMTVGAVIGFGIIAFAGVATLLEIYKGAQARHRAHGEPYMTALLRLVQRDRRRYGGYMIHLGVVVMGIGIIASSVFQDVRQQTLLPGETLELGGYTMRYDQLSRSIANDNRQMFIADVTLFKDGEIVDTLRPRRDIFETGSPMSIAGVHSTVNADFYVLLAFWDGNQATFRVYYNPLISLVWTGSLFLVFGTLIASWPERARKTAPIARRLSKVALAPAGD